MTQNEPHITGDWKTATNSAIAKNLLNSVASLLDGRWYSTETLDYKGKRTYRYIVELEVPKGPDGSYLDVPRLHPGDS